MNFINSLMIIVLLCFVISIEIGADEIIQKFTFKRSNFVVIILKQMNDIRYMAKLYNGEIFLQTIHLGTAFVNHNISVAGLLDGVELFSQSNSVRIQFKITMDVEGFSALQVVRELKKDDIVTDCLDLEPENMNWYGGPQHKKQLYPVQKMKIKDHAFIPTDDYPIMERYWLNSRGVLFDVHYTTPLFVDQNTIQADRLCFTAKNELPYLLDDFNGGAFSFKYTIGFSTDAKKTHMNFVTTRFGLNKPRSIPNERLVKYPIWNTSVRYGRIINEQMITDFLSEISQNKFNYSMMIIDDFWEEKCYGSMKIDKAKFPDMKNLITELKKKHDGIAFSLWIHPFINKNCDPYYTIAKNNDYLVKTIDGSFDTTWWNSETNGAAHINFLNPEASNWFKNQLKKLKEESGVDTFKLVAGETNFFPANANTTLNRFLIMQNYLKISNDFGNMMELNSGLRTQYLSVFVRMEGLYSRWTSDNGLKALIPRLIQINLMGYYFILPDNVGGNRYGDDITKELFIRWLQATVFMSGIQFSVAPWDFDEETVEIAEKFTKLHLDYAEFILQRFQYGITKGEPVNPPIWWINPEDKEAQKVSDQFLLGETILSAPVLEQGAEERDIYLPDGYWKDGNNGSIYEGKRWLRNYPAPIEVLPYFIRQFNTSALFEDIGEKSSSLIKQIYFKRSEVSASIQKRKSDSKYYIKIFNGNKFVQSVLLNTNFGNSSLEIKEIPNGYELSAANDPVRISITIDIDVEDFSVLNIERKMSSSEVATDCFDLEPSSMNWYGGSYSAGSEYPIQKFVYKNFGYVPDSRNFNERYWLNSRGICIFVDYDVPLFVDQNSIEANHICFTAKMNLPYSTRDTTFNFNYKIGFSANARRTHINVINRFFKTPKGRPDKYLVKNPIRTFGSNINEKGVKNLITDIQQKYWYNRMFIIDGVDKSCHGSLAIDKNRFPNMKILVTDIKKRFKGAIVALLVDPFISCTVNLEFTRNNNYLVKSMDGNIIWWKIHPNSTQSAQVDFSNLNAANWYRNQLKKLKEESGFDTFKFATGFPQDPHISKSNYSILAAEFGTDVTVRMGWKTQGLNVFTEVNLLLPNYSVNDGLKSLIPKLINSNMQGYNFIYPECLEKDKVGPKTKEFYIRWAQATVFMPVINYCFGPLKVDQETMDIEKKLMKLHTDYSDLINERFDSVCAKGHPVNPPIWWLDPEDKTAQTVADEYLLGETILVAPVLEVGKIQRDIYLPVGSWKDGNSGTIHEGKSWLRQYSAPLSLLPYFIRQNIMPSLLDDFEPDKLIQQIDFQNSRFSIKIEQRHSDNMIFLNVFNDNSLIQNIKLGTDYGDHPLKVSQIPNGYEISTDHNLTLISFTIDINDKDFSVLNIRRNLTNTDIATDCFELEPSNMNWYGGPQQENQSYPIQKFIFKDFAYIPKDQENAAIMERYWLNSRGFFVFIDYDVPLFVDQNTITNDSICFTARKALPYNTHNNKFTFNYKIGFSIDARKTHMNVINRIMKKPLGIPNEKLVRYPIWNTGVRYGRDINEQIIRDFADEISKHRFNCSLLEIDDFWEEGCYGSKIIDKVKFPNMNKLTTELKSKFKEISIVMWVHPFMNKNCETYYTSAKNNDHLMKSMSGSYDTSWWNSGTNGAGHIDFANPVAAIFFKNKLIALQEDHGIDSFTFDAGVTSYYPIDSNFSSNSNLFPGIEISKYVRLAALFGDMIEVRTGWGTQDLNIMVGMMDFDSRWGWDNGLITLIPTLIQMNLNGYPFVIPDMIGGNRYADNLKKELFIRWLQATVFMPSMQFSVPPWDFDDETIAIALKYTKIHLNYSDLILQRFNLAVSKGDPVNPPIWWLDPKDKIAQIIYDEFLLGETILAAPVVEQGKVQRDIYLPKGSWKDGNDDTIYEGKRWLRNYSAPLDVLPFFIKQ